VRPLDESLKQPLHTHWKAVVSGISGRPFHDSSPRMRRRGARIVAEQVYRMLLNLPIQKEALMPNPNPTLIAAAVDHGIVSKQRAEQAWEAANAVGIPYWAACAFLVQESSGGQNVYGSDSGQQFAGVGEVTEDNYRIYRIQRDRKHACGARYGNQGVGPMQLTASSLQDTADVSGGCWDVGVNMRVAFGHIQALREQKKKDDPDATIEDVWHFVALRYNGSEAYADKMDARFTDWRGWLREAQP
jgi:hypothetical protein